MTCAAPKSAAFIHLPARDKAKLFKLIQSEFLKTVLIKIKIIAIFMPSLRGHALRCYDRRKGLKTVLMSITPRCLDLYLHRATGNCLIVHKYNHILEHRMLSVAPKIGSAFTTVHDSLSKSNFLDAQMAPEMPLSILLRLFSSHPFYKQC